MAVALLRTVADQRAPGDFTGLAGDYEKYRPGYCPDVVKAIVSLLSQPADQSDAADVGAGTGIFTRLLARQGFRQVTAVEPNDDMRREGKKATGGTSIQWRAGQGEKTGLADQSVDLLTMASSFHWVDFARGTEEFHRVLRPAGCFAALWNPRLLEANPLLVEIEAKARAMAGDSSRVSSGMSGRAEQMNRLFEHSTLFGEPIYMEGRHTVKFTPDAYLGVWRSVNDWRVKLGPDGFADFLNFVAERIAGLEFIETTYLTRAWVVRKAC
ncbi:MAG: class I SAM-dependent methyltransferase [Alphaproteobacteria bacterium]|nr:class I SAM-dependent methyltransferase [Alphaproteobacteria bacterium]